MKKSFFLLLPAFIFAGCYSETKTESSSSSSTVIIKEGEEETLAAPELSLCDCIVAKQNGEMIPECDKMEQDWIKERDAADETTQMSMQLDVDQCIAEAKADGRIISKDTLETEN